MNMDQKPQDDKNLGSFYIGRRPPPAPERVLPKGGLSVVALLAFAAVVWYAYPTSEEVQDAADVPVVMADKAAYKFTPDDPGGMKVPHQDSTVFDPLDKKEASRVEKLLPSTEEPINKDDVLKPEVVAAVPAETPAGAEAPASADNAEKLVSAAPAAKPVDKTEAETPVSKEPAAKAAPVAAVVEDVKTAAVEPAKKVESVATKPAAQAAASLATGGNVYIQLGSYRNTEGAAIDWKKLQQKHPELLKGLDMRTQRVDLGAKGVFNRLQAGAVSEARAKEICAVLKTASSGGCMVVR